MTSGKGRGVMQGRKWLVAMVLGLAPLACAQAQPLDARAAAMQVQASYPGMIELEVDASREAEIADALASLGEGPAELRQRVIALFKDAGVSVEERTVKPGELDTADEIFSTGNYAKVQPCTRYNGRDMQIGRFATQAREMYWRWMEAQPKLV